MKPPQKKFNITHILAGVAPGQWWNVWRGGSSPGKKGYRVWVGVVGGSEEEAVAKAGDMGADEIEEVIPLSER
jgi:hypothetical protein